MIGKRDILQKIVRCENINTVRIRGSIENVVNSMLLSRNLFVKRSKSWDRTHTAFPDKESLFSRRGRGSASSGSG